MTVALDSWAVLRYLEDAEPAASRVHELLHEHPFAYADAFAAATAIAHAAALLTGDPELLRPNASWQTDDLRGLGPEGK